MQELKVKPQNEKKPANKPGIHCTPRQDMEKIISVQRERSREFSEKKLLPCRR